MSTRCAHWNHRCTLFRNEEKYDETRVFAQPEHPVVIFLDDLQWADVSTLQFLETLWKDRTIRHLLLIGAYRDHEVHAGHPLRLTLERLHTIRPIPLREDEINPIALFI